MKQWGANVVRVFRRERGGEIEQQLQKLREMGGVKAVIIGINSSNGLDWTNPDLEERCCKTWGDLATRLLTYRDVIWGYDLVNEPLDRSQLPRPPREWRRIATRIIETIRGIDDRTWIIYEVGPGGMFAGFKDLEPLPDKRIIYSAHYYCPHEFTHTGVTMITGTMLPEAMKMIRVPYPLKISPRHWEMDILQRPPMNIPRGKCLEWNKEFQRLILQPAVEFQKSLNVPIYAGEFSTVRWGDVDTSIRYLREAIELFEEYGWSWSYHAFNEWTGWNPEHPEGPDAYWMPGMPPPKPAESETRRAKLLKEAFRKNRQ
jgi:hypothetical protein